MFSLPSSVVASIPVGERTANEAAKRCESNRSTTKVEKEAFLMDRPWFDQETDVLLIDEYIVEMDSYKRIVEDGKLTDTELLEQTLRVTTLLRQLEEALSPEAKALATEALGEMAVLNALQALRLQASSPLP
jgi:hypothetical protein